MNVWLAGRVVCLELTDWQDEQLEALLGRLLSLPDIQQVEGPQANGVIALTFQDSPLTDEWLVRSVEDAYHRVFE